MIWSIGDLHFDHTKEKSMDVFGKNWENHEDKIIEFWKENIKDDDLVLVPGDISWALKFEESLKDLEKIDKLPGKKVLSKGNHDYWWPTKKKLEDQGFDSIHFLYNDYYVHENFIVFGSRGWMPRDADIFDENDEKIFSRELNRLKLSFDSYKGEKNLRKIVMLHYPPFNSDGSVNEFVDLMNEYNVEICVYGHLHGDGHEFVQEGTISKIEFHCVASDYIDFQLKKIL